MFHAALASAVGALLVTFLLAAAPPPPGGAFASGIYRNLFVEAGHSARESRAKIDAAFRQLFHGDPSTQALYYPAGSNANGPLAYILDPAHHDVRSEGLSYGMMVAVQLDKKPEFDALWNWARTYMHHAQGPAQGFFSWSAKTDGKPNDEMPAPDGEEYFATSLYFAAGRWGNGAGIYDYKAEADRLLIDMLHRAEASGPTVTGRRTAGALFDASRKMVRFTPVLEDRDHTDPSYHLPAFYELWARWGPVADRAFWAQAATASRTFFEKAAHPATGLAPEYANFDGTPWTARWNKRSADFSFDSWRTAMNWAVDWAWWTADPREQQRSDRLQAFFESQGANYGNEYTLDGRPLDKDHSAGLTATNAVVSLAATKPRARAFVEALWKLPIPSGEMRYYDGMLYMLALLHCGGEFRIWGPGGNSEEAVDAAVKRLAAVSTFAFGVVGDPGVISEGEIDFKLVSSQSAPTALAAFEQLYASGNPQAKAYALFGMKKLSLNRYKELLAIAEASAEQVEVMRGCKVSYWPLHHVAKQIDGDEFR